jgi:hypothetical protein
MHQTWHAYSMRTVRDFRKVQTQKIVLCSSPGEGGCCSSETEHNRRKASRTKLLASDSR